MSRPEDETARHELRSFGRRRGRALSAHQATLLDDVLPRLSVDLAKPAPEALGELFATRAADVWLEIGFGGAEHLIWQAQHNPSTGFIGCEPFQDGVVKAVSAIEAGGMGNVRLFADDGRPLLRWLPPRSIGRAFILFPDPWPKKRHAKRRLVGAPLLDLLARAMKPGAELRVATDIGDYARTTLAAIGAHPEFSWEVTGPDDWRLRPADWPETRYERKAEREGRRRYYFRFTRA
jgi:tRNA (guanine-N7-)-methyltransferase